MSEDDNSPKIYERLVNLATVTHTFHVSSAELDRQFRQLLAVINPKSMPSEPVLLDLVLRGRYGNEDCFEAANRLLVTQALQLCKGSQKKAAEILKTSPRVLNYQLKKYAMRPKDKDENASGSTSLSNERRDDGIRSGDSALSR
jgi:DNA-binding NtrC family response regulator